jgi:hypothetical protein
VEPTFAGTVSAGNATEHTVATRAHNAATH